MGVCVSMCRCVCGRGQLVVGFRDHVTQALNRAKMTAERKSPELAQASGRAGLLRGTGTGTGTETGECVAVFPGVGVGVGVGFLGVVADKGQTRASRIEYSRRQMPGWLAILIWGFDRWCAPRPSPSRRRRVGLL